MLKKIACLFFIVMCNTIVATPLVTIETVTVADAGNESDPDTGFGKVDNVYKIGKYNVTIEQYVSFLNSKAKYESDPVTELLWNVDMSDPKHKEKPGVLITRSESSPYVYTVANNSNWGALSGKRPICWVSWFDAARFANWMHNGANDLASTEDGAYTLVNYQNSGIVLKEPTAKWWIPSEDEWYKAAYYDPTLNQNGGGYYTYPTRSNDVPYMESNPPGLPNSANFNNVFNVKGNVLTPVGIYATSPSYYNTYDQGGLLWQWTDGIYQRDVGPNRIVRGGSFSYGITPLRKTTRRDYAPGFYEDDDTGFRLACSPDPSSGC